jgi:Type II secretion system (T2SS), protein E, N-terminal domain
VADDAGALLVRSGLVSSKALDDARARVTSIGGTLGEQLVTGGAISDDDLTDFFRSRLLVPQVNPNQLARLTAKVVATIPSDMAIELRAVPVSLDGDNNLTVAMSDPSDRHAVDEIAFFTGAYVVRAVATQMQIAWCLAHYYGHVTALGQRLLYSSGASSPLKDPAAATQRAPRAKGLTGKVDAARHRAIAPITGPVNVVRPNSGELDLRPLRAAATPAGTPQGAPSPASPTASPAASPASPASPTASPASPASPTASPASPASPTASPTASPASPASPTASPASPTASPASPASPTASPASPASPTASPASPASPTASPASPAASPASPASPTESPASPTTALVDPRSASATSPELSAAMPAGLVPRAAADAPTLPPTNDPAPARPPSDSAPRARAISGEIRAPSRRAASIRPPLPEPDDDDDPEILIEGGGPDDEATGQRAVAPPRRRAVKSDPPELYARAGEVDLKQDGDRAIDADEPRIVIDDYALSTPTGLIARGPGRASSPVSMLEVIDDADTGALIHDRLVDDASQPILLDRARASIEPRGLAPPTRSASQTDEDSDTGEIDVVVLDARKKPRPERRTQVGIPPAPVIARRHRDTEATGVPAMIDHASAARAGDPLTDDATMLDLRPAPADDDASSDQLAVPPAPSSPEDTNPYLIAEPPPPSQRAATRRTGPEPHREDDHHLGEPHAARASVMAAVAPDPAGPERATALAAGHLTRRSLHHDALDDGWGPPGTTIPPPLLGAIPGSEDEDEEPSTIPMPDVDSLPLIVEPRSAPAAASPTGGALVRALEEATARAIEVIRQLERAETRDQVVGLMVAHLAETHHRAGFFVTRHGASRGASELGLFSMVPRPAVVPFATLRLDRPSTLQDVVGTRLPYRGPMHDDASRTFLISVLGACPPEILLVPVAVRERVVGVLFGEHRQRHTFDDQLALAARAAGMALERLLKTKRS